MGVNFCNCVDYALKYLTFSAAGPMVLMLFSWQTVSTASWWSSLSPRCCTLLNRLLLAWSTWPPSTLSTETWRQETAWWEKTCWSKSETLACPETFTAQTTTK